jgi:aldehyde dehydrogenase (NAD+)
MNNNAVAAGCAVVIKPSELSSLQTQVLVEALHEANLPKGLLNVITGLGNVVGAELVRNPDVAKISFTGSVAVGQTIMRDGAATMKRVTLELGGKSPTILLDGSVLDQAIPAALFSNKIVTQMLSECPRRRYSSTVEGQPCSIHLLK